MGHVCFQCLPMKIVSYIQNAKDLEVTVKLLTGTSYGDKCDICGNNRASFQVSYYPKEAVTNDKCTVNNTNTSEWIIQNCTCYSHTPNICPVHSLQSRTFQI